MILKTVFPLFLYYLQIIKTLWHYECLLSFFQHPHLSLQLLGTWESKGKVVILLEKLSRCAAAFQTRKRRKAIVKALQQKRREKIEKKLQTVWFLSQINVRTELTVGKITNVVLELAASPLLNLFFSQFFYSIFFLRSPNHLLTDGAVNDYLSAFSRLFLLVSLPYIGFQCIMFIRNSLASLNVFAKALYLFFQPSMLVNNCYLLGHTLH